MAGMKITPASAMRARDVSRPRAEHLAAAAEREEAVTRHGDMKPGAVTATGALPRPVPRPWAPAGAMSRGTLPAPAAPPATAPPTDVPSAVAVEQQAVAVEQPSATEPAATEPAAASEPATARRRRRRGH